MQNAKKERLEKIMEKTEKGSLTHLSLENEDGAS